MKLNLLYGILLSLFIYEFGYSQNTLEYARVKPNLEIVKSKNAIKIDGIFDEPDWEAAKQTSKFHQIRPYDSSFALLQTEVKITFDDKNIYVAAKCYEPKKILTVSSLKRDFEAGTSDVFTINIDTFKDRLNGYQFAISPFNIQREGLIVFSEEFSTYWDNKWHSATKIYDDYWTVEMAIPFKSIRYKVEDSNIWGLNFGRNTLKNNEVSTWAPVPRNFKPSNLAYAGDLIWTSPPPHPGANISLIPYASGITINEVERNEDLQRVGESTATSGTMGMDVKVGIGPSLNLDLTFNPDFSQVEVDQQQTNLNRFELFYPERRQFFLENSDLFGNFGFPNTRPFFSRRIGIAYNPITNNNQAVKILAGARLSGKLTNNLRIGLLNAQTQKIDFGRNVLLPAANYTVLTFQQKLWTRSTISAIFSNKYLGLKNFSEAQKTDYQQYNRVAGLEFNFNSKDGRFDSETYYHQSFSPSIVGSTSSIANYVGYHHPNLDLNFGLSRVGQNYQADMGYVPRKGITSIYWPMELSLYPKNPKVSRFINKYGLGFFQNETIFNLKGKLLDNSISPYFHLFGPSGNNFFIGYGFVYTYLFSSFDPTNSSLNPNPDKYRSVVPLPVGSYHFSNFYTGYESSLKNNLSGSYNLNIGGFFNGKQTTFEGQINYRLQPIGNFSVNYGYYDLQLPAPYNKAKYWLIGPKAEISFSKSVFFSNFFQYNTQTNNFNINSRLQWRFKPVSDMFLVYSDNRFADKISKYGIDAFSPKNKTLVFKISYWFNV